MYLYMVGCVPKPSIVDAFGANLFLFTEKLFRTTMTSK